MKTYFCKHCGQIIAIVKETGSPLKCCGLDMEEIDASKEKHVPVVIIDGNMVKVSAGSVEHPMVKNHYIEWIAI